MQKIKSKKMTLMMFCFSVLLFVTLSSYAENHGAEFISGGKQRWQSGVYTKDDVLKMRDKIAKTIVVPLAGARWINVEKLISNAKKSSADGEGGKAAKYYNDAGKLLACIIKEHPYKKLQNGSIQLGLITLDTNKKMLSFPAKVTYHREMPVEVILCRPNSDRNYETLFTSEMRPLHLQTLLYLAGFVNGAISKNSKKASQGAKLTLLIRYKSAKDGKVRSVNVNDMLINSDAGRKLEHFPWIFVGSNIYHGKLVADLTGESIISWCVSPAVIEPSNEKIASGEEHIDVNAPADLPDKTDVTFIIKPFTGQ